jgi:hypothetical protein
MHDLSGDRRMTPETVHLIAQEIRHQRALLTVQEAWWQQQPKTVARDEGFRRINFWRRVLKDAESRLTVGDDGEAVDQIAS